MADQRSVTLRPPADDDADLLYRLAAELDTWEERTPAVPGSFDRSSWEARQAETRAGGQRIPFVIVADRTPVGRVELFAFDELARHAEVGISLLAEARGRGIGTAALQLIVEFGFVRCNLRRLHLEAIESNRAAIRSYERAGFVVEGRQREHAWVRGRYEDIVRMGLLRSEWRSRVAT